MKLFCGILDSSVWCESAETRLVWITLLAMADRNGYVGAAVPGVAARARVSVEAAERALATFLAPDPHSRSKEHGGRRIEVVERGWKLLNYGKFRESRQADLRRDQYRQSKRKRRALTKKQREVKAFDEAAGNVAPDYVYEEG